MQAKPRKSAAGEAEAVAETPEPELEPASEAARPEPIVAERKPRKAAAQRSLS